MDDFRDRATPAGAVTEPVPAGRARLRDAVLFTALVALLYADPLFVRRNFSGRDLIAYNLPLEKSVHDAWARGRLPVWTPEVSGGRPLAPNPNAGALYPIRALLAPLPLPLGVRIFPILHWAAAGVGVLMLAAALGRSRGAAWVAAVTYVFSGVAVAEAFFPHIQPGMALLPWIVWAAGRRTGSPASRVVVLAILFALVFLAADVFTIAVAIVSAALWIALEEDPGAGLRRAGALAAAVGLGALAAAPQIVATALWIPHTNRAVLGMTLGDVLLFSIHPWRLLELAAPHLFGPIWELDVRPLWGHPLHNGRPSGLFPTLYAGAFALVAVFLAWRSRSRGARFARALLVLALGAAVLPSLLPGRWKTLSAPLPLRNPEKLAVAVTLALAVFAAIAYDAWRERPRRERFERALLAIGAVFAVLAAFAALRPQDAGRAAVSMIRGDPAKAPRAAASLPRALSEAGLFWMATVVGLDALGRRTKRGEALALTLLTLVPVAANRRIARSFSEEEVFGPTAFARFVAKRDPDGAYRTLGESFLLPPSKLALAQAGVTLSESEFSRRTWYQQTPVFWGRGTVLNEDFDAGDLSRVESLRRIAGRATGFLDSSSFFGALGLRTGIRFRDQEAIAGFREVRGDALQVWDEHPGAYPDIRLLETWSEAADPVEALAAIPRLAEGEIVLESGRSGSGRARAGTVRVTERTAERLTLDLDAPDPTWVFVLRAFWPYRSVEIDGAPAETVPAQLGFTAVPIAPGRHRLVWCEELPGIRISRWGPVLFGMILATLCVTHWRRRTG
jgi:hypothetical protein